MWMPARDADIRPSVITPALWGVFSYGEWGAKGACALGFTPLRLSIKACPSEARAVCRVAGTCPYGGSVAQPLRWLPALQHDHGAGVAKRVGRHLFVVQG